jgi:hypothetical protein
MCLTHGSAQLLLVGDAEEMCWEIMRKNGAPLKADVIRSGIMEASMPRLTGRFDGDADEARGQCCRDIDG